jgi:hypothetical protein
LTEFTDDRLHLEQADPQPNWMENLCFFGVDEATQSGFFIHMKIRPHQGDTEFRVAVKIANETCTYGAVRPLTGGFRYTGCRLDCLTQGSHWRIRVAGTGRPIAAAANLVGLPTEGRGSLLFEFDLQWTSSISPLDWAVLKNSKETDSAGSHHYDQGGRFAGTLRIGDRRIEAAGLAYRDHSWGPRNFMQMRVARFIGFVTEDMRTYFDGLFIDHGAGKAPVGFSYTLHDGVGKASSPPVVSVTEGEDWDHGYRAVSVAVPEATYRMRTLWNVAMPLIPERYLSNIAMVRVELPDGRSGFGIVERGRLLGDEELSKMKLSQGQ